MAMVGLLVSLAVAGTIEDTELRDLDVTGWDCESEGSAQCQDAQERNRMKNRWASESLFVHGRTTRCGRVPENGGEYDSRLQSKRRGELTAAQKGELDSYRTIHHAAHTQPNPRLHQAVVEVALSTAEHRAGFLKFDGFVSHRQAKHLAFGRS
jgi:hypothetical protein